MVPVKMIVQFFNHFVELRDTSPILLLISLEEREDACKTGNLISSFPGILYLLGWWVDILIQTTFLNF